MTGSPVRRRGESAPPTTTLARPPQLVTPIPTRWGERSALLGGAALILAGALQLDGSHHRGLPWLILAAAAAAVVVGFHGWRSNRRRARVAALTNVLTQLTKTAVIIERARWRGLPVGRIVELRLRYSDLAAATYGTQITSTLTQAVNQALGYPFIIHGHSPTRRRIVLAAKPETPARELTELEKQQQRIKDVVTETLGADASVETIATTPDRDAITGFTVRVRSGAAKLTIAGARRRLANAITERLVGAWTANFTLEGDTITFARRPPLPTYVERPATPPPTADDPEFGRIPQAVDENGQLLVWEITGVQAHILKAGRTRSGKACAISTPIATTAGWTAMGQLKVGDRVFDERGQPTTVTGVFDQPHGRLCVEVLFSDGSTIICDEEHLWYTQTRAARISERESISKEPTRARRPRLSPEIVASLIAITRSCSDSDTITIAEAAQLVQLGDTDPWLRQTAAAVGCVGFEQEARLYSYRAQTVIQQKQYKAYPAAATYKALATKAESGKYPNLSPHREALHHMVTEGNQHDTVTARDLAELLNIPYWQAGRWIAACGLEHQLEERQCRVEIEAKEVTRAGRRARVYPRGILCEALAGDGDRILLDKRARRIAGAVRTTQQIRDTLRTATGHVNHSVPVARALQLPDTDLPVPPYTLGAYLGDGDSLYAHLTSADPEIISYIEADGYTVIQNRLKSDAWKASRSYKIVNLRPQLRQLGLLKRRGETAPRKRIPQVYLRASERQRRDLLAGLLDTDGTVAPRGRVEFVTIYPGLADDVLELALSLGYRATRVEGLAELYGQPTGPKWLIAFTTQDPVFRLPRKLDSLRERTQRLNSSKVSSRYIVDVRPVPSVPLRCITVDSPNHLYLAGRSMIPTHNTVSLIGDAIEAARRGFRVFVLDPKRIEFLGLRGWPNVQLVATRVPEQVALVHYLWSEMTERYRLVEEDGAQESDFQPILFIIDEYRQLHANVNAWWKSIKITGMPSECPIFEEIGALLRMAAACRIHVDLATQRPDAEFLGGEALAIDTPIPTPAGWTTMADLEVGQYVLNECGRPAQIVAATEVQRGRPCYRVTFSDDSSLIADEDHLWTVTESVQPLVRARSTSVALDPHHALHRRAGPNLALRTMSLLVPTGRTPVPQTVTTRHLAQTVIDGSGSTWGVQVDLRQEQLKLLQVLGQGQVPEPWRYVVRVEPVESVPVRCITVNTPSHLYLAGRSFIPTHNCRDNFSARAATGRLSPDGAAMMFDSQHVGVTIPMNVRGRGTMIGLDDRPQEVQFLYTPDPRRPRNDDDRALLSALRPETASWPTLVMQLPEIDEIVDDIPQGKKTNIEWEQLNRARFVPARDSIDSPELADDDTARQHHAPECQDSSVDADPEDRGSEDDACDGYREPALVPAGMVSTGDLLRDDERGWLTITDIARDGGLPEVQLEWQDDNGSTGDLLVSRSVLVEIRRLQVS